MKFNSDGAWKSPQHSRRGLTRSTAETDVEAPFQAASIDVPGISCPWASFVCAHRRREIRAQEPARNVGRLKEGTRFAPIFSGPKSRFPGNGDSQVRSFDYRASQK